MHCDICGKKTFIPVWITTSSICKTCFIKLNGPVWRCIPWDSYKSVKKLKKKTIEKANSLDCPDGVIDSLADYFDNITSKMNKCDGCGERVQKLHSIGKSRLCKYCYLAIDNSAWHKDEYEDNEAVEVNRNKILKKAKKEGFPQKVINDINAHFDSKIQEGLYKSIDGWLDQKLKVFETHCILHTSKNFDYEDIANKYYRYMKQISEDTTDEGFQNDDIFQNLAYGFMNKNMKDTVVSLIVDAIDNKIENSSDKGSLRFKLVKGDYEMDYEDFDSVDYYRLADIGQDERFGFFSFKNSKEEILFFFRENNNDLMDDIYSFICKKIDKKKNFVETPLNVHDFSSADEIMKYKELFDAGAITEKEYKVKKKQLLGL